MPHKDLEQRRAYGRSYMKEWEKRNPQRRRQFNEEYKARIRRLVCEYKSARGCIQCGESHIACLDLHHRDPKQKEIDPSNMIKRGWGPERVKLELDKCDVICANCHRKLHWEERNMAEQDA